MKSDSMGKRNSNTHPVMAILLVVRCFVPEGHEKQRLDQGDSVRFVVEIVKKLYRCKY